MAVGRLFELVDNKRRLQLRIAENTRVGTEFALPTSIDAGDAPLADVRGYRLAAGNVNNAFRLETRRLNARLTVDLVVSRPLDREYRNRYELRVEAFNGAEPPRFASVRRLTADANRKRATFSVGTLIVNVEIVDENDNAPAFARLRYNARVAASATVGTTIIKIEARDEDAGDNARLAYRLTQVGDI